MAASERPTNRHYVLFLLLVVSIIAQIDRMAMAVLIQPIKTDFGLSDSEAGFLLGPAFVIFYAVFGIPFGLWADRGNRRGIIAIAISVWSVFTVTCGLAFNFVTMAMARMGVAIGEAGANPPAASIISDLYPDHERGTAMGVFSISPNIGILIGFAAAGVLSDALGWQYTFVIVGLPGLAVALILVTTVKEPARIDATLAPASASSQAIFAALMHTLRLMWAQRSIRHIILASSLTAFVGTGFSNWLPAYFERTYIGLDRGTIGIGLGLVIGVFGGAGTFLGGFLSDKFARRDVRWRLWLPVAAIILGWPIGVGSLFAGNYLVTLALIILPAFVALFHLASVWALMQSLVAATMRGTAIAAFMFVTNLLGGGGGPWYVGQMADLLNPVYGDMALAYALTSLILFAFWAAIHFYLASRYLAADLSRVRDISAK